MKAEGRRLILVHLLLLVLLYEIMFVPNQRTTVRDYDALLVGIAVIEALFLFALWHGKRRGTLSTGPFDIILVVWLLMIVWELTTSVLNVAHPVLVPCPENVFDTFRKQWSLLLLNVGYSMELLLLGFALGLTAAVLLGLVAGWVPRIRAFAYPIANVMAPIPAIVISPYLVALMPTFRSASLVVIILGIFWPTFLTTVNRVQNMEVQILDSARTLQPSTMTMLTRILLPYTLARRDLRAAGLNDDVASDAEFCRAHGRDPRHGLLRAEQHHLCQLHPCGGGHFCHWNRRDDPEFPGGEAAKVGHPLALTGAG